MSDLRTAAVRMVAAAGKAQFPLWIAYEHMGPTMNAIQWTVAQVKQPGRPGSRKIDTHATIEQIINRHGYCTSECPEQLGEWG